MKDFFETSLGCVAAIVFLAFGLLQLVLGYAGIENSFGWGWAIGALVVAAVFRFTLPIVVGCFLYASNVWGWHWFPSLLLALPGLLFMIPSLLQGIFGSIRSRR